MADTRLITTAFIVGMLALFLFWVGFPFIVSGPTTTTAIRLLTWVVIGVGYLAYKRRKAKRVEG